MTNCHEQRLVPAPRLKWVLMNLLPLGPGELPVLALPMRWNPREASVGAGKERFFRWISTFCATFRGDVEVWEAQTLTFACGRESWGCCSSWGCRARLAGGCCSHPAAAPTSLVLPGEGRVSLSPAWGERRTQPGWAVGGFQATLSGTMSLRWKSQCLGTHIKVLGEAELKGTFGGLWLTHPWARLDGEFGTRVTKLWAPSYPLKSATNPPLEKASPHIHGKPGVSLPVHPHQLILLLSKIHLESISLGVLFFFNLFYFIFFTACLAFKRQTLNPLHLRDSPKVVCLFPPGVSKCKDREKRKVLILIISAQNQLEGQKTLRHRKWFFLFICLPY